MERVCFRSRIRPELRDEYVRRHQEVWPDMVAALALTGWHNYTLFLEEDGTLIGYFETPDLDAAFAGIADLDVNTRWQAEMARFFPDADGRRPDEGFVRIPTVVHLTPPRTDAPPIAPGQPAES